MDKQNQVDIQNQPSQAASSEPAKPAEDREVLPSSPPTMHNRQQSGIKAEVYLSSFVEQRSYFLVSLVGYGLIAFALFDYINILIPLNLTNPVWEFQTIGALVEHAAIPLLGLMLVFFRHQGYIRGLEKNFLGFLSWVSLLVGLLYLLMLPLGVADTWRIYHANKAETITQLSQQSQQIQQLKVQLNQAKTDEQLEKLLANLTPQGRSLKIKNPQAFKDQLLTKISQTQRNIKVQANTAGKTQTQLLIKNSVKWNLGALITGVLFIWIWYLTGWAR
jgi:hypothetical protein